MIDGVAKFNLSATKRNGCDMTDTVWVCKGCGGRNREEDHFPGCHRCDGAETLLMPLWGCRGVLSSCGAVGHHGPAAPHFHIDLGARRRLLLRMSAKAVVESAAQIPRNTVGSLLERLEVMPEDHLEWMDEMESILRTALQALKRER